jgi:hypothetical protein
VFEFELLSANFQLKNIHSMLCNHFLYLVLPSVHFRAMCSVVSCNEDWPHLGGSPRKFFLMVGKFPGRVCHFLNTNGLYYFPNIILTAFSLHIVQHYLCHIFHLIPVLAENNMFIFLVLSCLHVFFNIHFDIRVLLLFSL